MTTIETKKKQHFLAYQHLCEKFEDRSASLFLGAGVNAGIHNKNGESFPLGVQLSTWISKDLLNEPESSYSLKEAAELTRFKVGPNELNNYIIKKFAEFEPGQAHLSIAQLPWDSIYTTNYDNLLERAFTNSSITSAGSIKPIYSMMEDNMDLREEEITYFKLHGDMNAAHTPEGRLILTSEDYRFYELYRKPLFKRLEKDLANRTLLFVGYSLEDDNFRATLQDCKSQFKYKNLPISYAVMKSFTPTQENYWRENYNIQLITADGATFLTELKETWQELGLSVIPFEERRTKKYIFIDRVTHFPKVGESFYQIKPSDCTGLPDAKRFFKGAEPTWADVREKIPPLREAYWQLFGVLIEEANDIETRPKPYLLTGAAGTGKTTLLYSIGYELASSGYPVLVHIPRTPLDARALGTILEKSKNQRIFIMIRHAAEMAWEIFQFIEELKHRGIPATLILEERWNQWANAAAELKKNVSIEKFQLESLSNDEIVSILDSLDKHNALGRLAGSTKQEQIEHFTALAEKDLLVALRELTSEHSFDNYVKDEYNKIPSEIAKQAYIYISAVGKLGLAIRYETLLNLFDFNWDEFRQKIYLPTEGVLLNWEEAGSSRHNYGFRLQTRHPIIASIIFEMAAPDEETKFMIINNLINELEPDFHEDRFLLRQIAQGKELVNTLSSSEKKRAVYELLEIKLPDDPFVLQHRSILEKDLNNPDASLEYARLAVGHRPDYDVFLNTLGFACEFSARFATSPFAKEALISEANKIFKEGIIRYPDSPFNYLGQYTIIKHRIQDEADPKKQLSLHADALALLEDAFEQTGESDRIAGPLAEEKLHFSTDSGTLDFLRKTIQNNSSNERLRDLLINKEINLGNFKDALALALEGVKYNTAAWRFYRHIARLKEVIGHSIESIIENYEAAIRNNKGNLHLLIEYGSFLVRNERQKDSNKVFQDAMKIPDTSANKNRNRFPWKDSTGRLAAFQGKVIYVGGGIGRIMAAQGQFEAFFWRGHSNLYDLRVNDSVLFNIAFTANGARAFNIQPFN